MNKTGVFFIGFGAGVVATLVLLAVGAVVLGFFAYRAVVAPQFAQATSNAQESALMSDTQTLRSQLELYKVQHGEKYPPELKSVGTDGKKFMEQLTQKTNAEGKIGKSDAVAPFGPYLCQPPTNPFARDDGSVKIGKEPCPGDGTSDWYFCTETGKLSPNDAQHKDQ